MTGGIQRRPGHLTGAEIQPTWLDRDQLADYLNIRVERIARLLKEGKLPTPSYHLGPKQPRYDRELVDRMMRGDNVHISNYAPPTNTLTAEHVGDLIVRELARRRTRKYAGQRSRDPQETRGRHDTGISVSG